MKRKKSTVKEKIKMIWNNKAQILEGVKNYVFTQESIEIISKQRMNICLMCEYLDVKGKECAVEGTQPCCADCGCSLKFKTRSLSSECPQNKWAALVTPEEEDDILSRI
jgi:hypothetical protein